MREGLYPTIQVRHQGQMGARRGSDQGQIILRLMDEVGRLAWQNPEGMVIGCEEFGKVQSLK